MKRVVEESMKSVRKKEHDLREHHMNEPLKRPFAFGSSHRDLSRIFSRRLHSVVGNLCPNEFSHFVASF